MYHAGIAEDTKAKLHEDWTTGKVQVVCATIGACATAGSVLGLTCCSVRSRRRQGGCPLCAASFGTCPPSTRSRLAHRVPGDPLQLPVRPLPPRATIARAHCSLMRGRHRWRTTIKSRAARAGTARMQSVYCTTRRTTRSGGRTSSWTISTARPRVSRPRVTERSTYSSHLRANDPCRSPRHAPVRAGPGGVPQRTLREASVPPHPPSSTASHRTV